MLRGTTPTVTLILPVEVNLEGASVCYMSFGQGEEEVFSVPIGRITLDDNTATALLTQEETLSLKEGFKTQVQLRWVKEGIAYGTKILKVNTDAIIKEGVI